MISVLCHRHLVQGSLLSVLVLTAAMITGCTPPEDGGTSPSTTTPPTATATDGEEKPCPEKPCPEKPCPEKPCPEKPCPEKPCPESTPTCPADETAKQEPAEETPAEETTAEETAVEEPAEEAVEEPAEEEVEQPAEEETEETTEVPEIDIEETTIETVFVLPDEPAEKKLDLTGVPAVEFMLEPTDVADSVAETEAGMKPYTEVITGTDVTFDMVPIPGGKFTMGSPDSEADRGDDEGPQHEVEIAPFWMGKFEVTWDEYDLYGMAGDIQRRNALKLESTERDKLADAIACPTKPYADMSFGMGQSGCPAICMTQLAARMYCKWLSAKTGRYYRLPTEAEWEYACRAGTTTAYSFGDDPDDLDDYAWYFDNSEDGYHKVGKKKPNPWGLYDMHGNAYEWVLDQYVADQYKKRGEGAVKNPLVPTTKQYPRVARGGCWDDDPDKLRSAARIGSSETWKSEDPQIPKSIWFNTEPWCAGFRVVRPLKMPTVEEAKLYEPNAKTVTEYIKAQAGKK